jgi:hypothetical protein
MTADDPRAHLRAFLTTRRATAAQLRRVNAALSRWDEYHASAAMPEDLRPPVTAPTLSRAALKELQAMLIGTIDELEESWERRN